MSKYNITINEINQENDQHTAQGTILRNGEEVQFDAVTIWYDGTRRWKVKEESGTAVAVDQSDFSRGERMGIARWLKEVSNNPELVGKSSGQGSGSTGSKSGGSSSRIAELEAQNAALQAQVVEMMAMMKEFMNKDS